MRLWSIINACTTQTGEKRGLWAFFTRTMWKSTRTRAFLTYLRTPSFTSTRWPTAVSSFSIAELFAQTFAINSTLDDTGHSPPTPPPSDYFIPKIKILYYDVFQPSLALILRRLTVWMESLLLFSKNVLPNSLTAWSNSFVCVSTSTYPSCWKFAHIQPVPKKGNHSNPPYYHPIALISCLCKVSESVPNKKIMRHLSAPNLLSDCEYGFWKDQFTGDFLAFLTESWSSSFRDWWNLCCQPWHIESLQ